ncbi:MAG: sugar ABC transporter substrate-binding protein [Actinomycetota bacterium]|nr:sugar ABC transporter substrate-binding protein [Actinomycetota bacterium]
MKRLFALGVAVVLVTGCASNDGDDPAVGGPGSIEFQVAGDPEEIVVYRSLVNDFEKSHEDIDVNLIDVADKDDHLTKLSTAFTGGNPPDVFLVNFREYSQFVVRGALEPVGPHLESMEIDTADYYEPPLEAFTFAGELQCMPQNISSLVVYYNKSLFKKAGVASPSDDWSWEDFRGTAVELTDGEVRGVGIEPSIIRLAPFVWTNGGEIVDDPNAPTRFTFDDPAAREALEFIVGLVRDDQVVPTEQEVTAAEDLETMFATGKLGMLLSSRRDTPEFREITSLKWDVAPLPQESVPSGILHSDAYCVAAGSDNHEAALEFISYAIGEQGQTITALGGRTVPSRMSVAQSGAFLNPAEVPSRSQVFLDVIPNIRRTPVIPTWPEIEDVAEEILTRAFYEDDYTIDDAITDLEEQTSSLFEEGSSAAE